MGGTRLGGFGGDSGRGEGAATDWKLIVWLGDGVYCVQAGMT